MFCHTPSLLPVCVEALYGSLKRGETSYGRVSRSLNRIERFKKRLRYRLPDVSARNTLFRRIGCAEHQRIAGHVGSFRTTGATTAT
jgi:hypothetical protein